MWQKSERPSTSITGGGVRPCNSASNFSTPSGTIIQEMHTDAWNASAAIALVEGMEWRRGRMVILNEAGGEVHSESK